MITDGGTVLQNQNFISNINQLDWQFYQDMFQNWLPDPQTFEVYFWWTGS